MMKNKQKVRRRSFGFRGFGYWKSSGLILLLGIAWWLPNSARAADRDTRVPVWIIGDSTVSDYSQKDKHRGWGQLIGELLLNGERVENRALSGASSKSYRRVINKWSSNAFWGDGETKSKHGRVGLKEDIAKADTSRGGYLLIQFGHNDSFKGQYDAKRKTVPGLGNEFDQQLMEYIKHAREHNVTPVLVTPMARMFNKSLSEAYAHREQSLANVPKPWQQMNGQVGDWPQTMRDVGKREGMIVLDLTTKSKDFFATFSDRQAILDLYSWDGKDPTHFNEAGARKMAEFIRDLAIKADPELAAQFKPVASNSK